MVTSRNPSPPRWFEVSESETVGEVIGSPWLRANICWRHSGNQVTEQMELPQESFDCELLPRNYVQKSCQRRPNNAELRIITSPVTSR